MALLNSKSSKVDIPSFRGTARKCPSCEGRKLVPAIIGYKKCETCLGTGIVHLGVYCQFCGRSVQFVYKEFAICGHTKCEEEVDKKLEHHSYVPDKDKEAYGYGDMFGLFDA